MNDTFKVFLTSVYIKALMTLTTRNYYTKYSTIISENRSLVAFGLFNMFTQSIKFCMFKYYIFDTENEQLLLSTTFRAKFEFALEV